MSKSFCLAVPALEAYWDQADLIQPSNLGSAS
jgi:hypothetical protein